MREQRAGYRTDKAESSTGRAKTSYSVRLDDDVLAQLRDLPKRQRQQIGAAIRVVQENFGSPHQHGGIGIRDLTAKGSRYRVYECRCSRAVRLVFTVEDGRMLYFHMLGTHDEVHRFLRSFL